MWQDANKPRPGGNNMKRTIAVLLILTLLLGSTAALAKDLGTGTVKGGWLRLRAAPTSLSSIIGRYYTGTKVTVHSATGTWYYVTAPDGKVGYMSRNYITLNGGGSGYVPTPSDWSGIPSGESGYVTSQNGRGVRLRSTPSSANASNVIGLYSVGTKLTVLQRGFGWHYISIGKQTGYMMSQFIVIGGTPGPIPPIDPLPDKNYKAYVTSLNGKGVRLRTGPGTNYGILGTYPVGTEVTVLKELGAWCYIQIAAKKGYMMSTFLTKASPGPLPPVPPVGPGGTIETAQITIQSPIIGDRLYVYVTPDNADYNVHWYNDLGYLLGTGNGYPVKHTDNGRRIRARVSGRNNWTGSVDTLFTDIVGQVTPDPSKPKQLIGTIKLPTVVQVNDVITAQVYDGNATALIYTWYVDGLKYAQKNKITITADMAGKSVQVVVTATGYTGSLTAVTQVQAAASSTPSDSGVEFITPVTAVPSSPETPDGPVAPVAEPEAPLVEPVTPVVETVVPVVETVTPVAEPVIPDEETATPVTEPVTPVVEAVTPITEPVIPEVETVTPAVEPVTPVAEPVTPVTEPATPVVETVTPVTEPTAPSAEPAAPVVEVITPAAEPAAPATASEPPVIEKEMPEAETAVPAAEPLTPSADPIVELIVP